MSGGAVHTVEQAAGQVLDYMKRCVLVGQEHVVRALTHALATGRLHHAWLCSPAPAAWARPRSAASRQGAQL